MTCQIFTCPSTSRGRAWTFAHMPSTGLPLRLSRVTSAHASAALWRRLEEPSYQLRVNEREAALGNTQEALESALVAGNPLTEERRGVGLARPRQLQGRRECFVHKRAEVENQARRLARVVDVEYARRGAVLQHL